METSKRFFIDNNVRPKDVITLENVTRYCKKADSPILEFIELYNKSKKLIFNTGWVLWNTYVQNGDKVFYVASMYVKKADTDVIAGLIELVKDTGYDKIEFKTRRNVDVWKKRILRYSSQENDISIAGTISCDLEGV